MSCRNSCVCDSHTTFTIIDMMSVTRSTSFRGLFFCLALSFLLLTAIVDAEQNVTTNNHQQLLHLGIMDWNGVDGTNKSYHGIASTAFAAVMIVSAGHFNNRRVDIFPQLSQVLTCDKNITIERYCDTGGDALRAARNTLWMIREYPIDAIIGFAGLEASFAGSMVAASYEIPVIDYSVTSSRTSDKHDFPLYARTVPNDESIARMFALLMQQLKYRRVALLYMSDDAKEFATGFAHIMKTNGGSGEVSLVEFTYGLENSTTIRSSMKRIADLKNNIIICATWMGLMPQVASAAIEFDLVGEDRLWIFSHMAREPSEEDYRNANISKLWHGSMWLRPTNGLNPNLPAFIQDWTRLNSQTAHMINSNLPPYGTGNDFRDCANAGLDLQIPIETSDEFFRQTAGLLITPVAGYVVDAILAFGFAMCQDNLRGPIPKGRLLYDKVIQNSFVGLSGRNVKFNSNGDRDESSSGFSLWNWNHSRLNLVAVWNSDSQSFQFESQKLVFKGTAMPRYDITPPHHERNLLPEWTKVLGYIEASLVFLCGLHSLIWLRLNSNLMVVKLSQPLFMRLIVVGICCLGAAIVPLTFEDSDSACMAFPWLLTLGITFAIAPIMVKSYRVGKMWFNPGFLHERKERSRKYLIFVVSLVLIEVVVLLAWTFTSPLVYRRFTTVVDVSGNEISSYGACVGSSNASLGFAIGLLTVNGLIAVSCVLVSLWVSNAPERYHDARWSSLAAVVLGQFYLFGIPIVVAVFTNTLARYFVLTSLCFVTAMAVWGVIFVPKMVLAYHSGGFEEENMDRNHPHHPKPTWHSDQVQQQQHEEHIAHPPPSKMVIGKNDSRPLQPLRHPKMNRLANSKPTFKHSEPKDQFQEQSGFFFPPPSFINDPVSVDYRSSIDNNNEEQHDQEADKESIRKQRSIVIEQNDDPDNVENDEELFKLEKLLGDAIVGGGPYSASGSHLPPNPNDHSRDHSGQQAGVGDINSNEQLALT